MVDCNMPCCAILVEENVLVDLVIVCEFSKIFPSKCTDKAIMQNFIVPNFELYKYVQLILYYGDIYVS